MIIFDTETTGLIRSTGLALNLQPHIIELFALKVDAGLKPTDKLHFLCNPGIPISEEITGITGIMQKDVDGEVPFGMYLGDLQKFFLGEEVVCAHNASYDLDMLNLELRRLDAVQRFPWPPLRLCTVEATEFIRGHRMNLTSLHEHLFQEGFTAHRAESDVMATHRCLERLVDTKQVKIPGFK